MRTLLTTLLISIVLALSGQSFAAQRAAGAEQDSTAPTHATLQSNGVTLEQAVEKVRRKYKGGQIVSAVTKVNGGRETHEIRVLTADGKVKTERVPGKRRG